MLRLYVTIRGMWWLRERIHPTWQVTWVLLGFVAGAAAAKAWQVPMIALIPGLLLAGIASYRRRRWLCVIAFAGGSLLGLVRGSIDQTALAYYQPLYGHRVELTATVSGDVDAVANGAVHLRLDRVLLDGHQLTGQVWATVKGGELARRSDVVTVAGMMSEGFGSFAASLTAAQVTHISRPVPGDVALDVRDGFASAVRRVIDEPSASLGIGYLLGQKSALPMELQEALKIAGLTHIVVASGYNLTILVRICRRLFAKISKYMATASGAAMIVGFMAITGLSPSMSRAGLVSGLSLWAWYYGRAFHPVTLLAVASAVTVALNPSYVWGDIGWLLSFAAFAGVLIIAPLLTAYFFGEDKPPLVVQVLVETVSATIATAPILILAFGQFSNIALFSNLLILPFIPLAMLLTALAGVGGIIGLTFVGQPASWLLDMMVRCIQWCASFSWAQVSVAWSWWQPTLYVVVVAGACFYMKYRTKLRFHEVNVVE